MANRKLLPKKEGKKIAVKDFVTGLGLTNKQFHKQVMGTFKSVHVPSLEQEEKLNQPTSKDFPENLSCSL